MKSGTVLNVKSDSNNFFKLVVSHIVASPHYLLASKFCMGAPNSLGNFAWGCQIPYYIGGANIPEGVPISLGNFAWGCQILRDSSIDHVLCLCLYS